MTTLLPEPRLPGKPPLAKLICGDFSSSRRSLSLWEDDFWRLCDNFFTLLPSCGNVPQPSRASLGPFHSQLCQRSTLAAWRRGSLRWCGGSDAGSKAVDLPATGSADPLRSGHAVAAPAHGLADAASPATTTSS